MTFDLSLDLAPDGGAGVKLTFTDPAGAGAVLARAMPALDAARLDALRRGDSGEADVRALTDGVSGWILGDDLVAPVAQALAGNRRLRVLVRMDRGLDSALSDLPVELVTLPHALQPLVLHPNVGAMIHVPPVVATLPTPPIRDWPMRILIVRSNPQDLGGAVPPVGPIRDEILDAATGAGMPEGAVQVEVVSSEEQGADPVTWKRFRETLASQVFDVLVYLGHGDMQQAFAETAPVGYLQFESGAGHEAIDARRIAAELFQHPIRVVVLAGCLTAAQLAQAGQEVQELVAASLPQWLRGAQGVAQAIVDSEAGVELAVGMRDRLEVERASLFLKSFFKSLIRTAPGDVERAVRAARDDLFGEGPVPPTWSSAVVFAKGAPPVFQFLAEPPTGAAFSAEKQAKLETIRGMRRVAAKLFLEALTDRAPFLQTFPVVANEEKKILGKEAMIRPRFVSSPTGSVPVDVELVGSVTARRLDGRVEISGDGVTIDRLVPDPRLNAAGFDFLWGDGESGKARFAIEREAGAARLTAGRLFTIKTDLTSTPPAIHEVVVTRAASDTKAVVWSGMDVIAVVP